MLLSDQENMSLEIKNLYETWFAKLNLMNSGIPSHRIPTDDRGYRPWRCVCDTANHFLVTQLISTSFEMKEGQYYYCLFINHQSYISANIYLHHYSGRFIAQGICSIDEISSAEIQNILGMAVKMLLDDARIN